MGASTFGGLNVVLRKREAGKEVFLCFANVEQDRAILRLPDWYL